MFGEKHAVFAGAGIDTMVRLVEVIQDLLESIAQPETFVGIARGNCVQHVIDRIVPLKALFTLRGDAEHYRALVLVRSASDKVRLFLKGLHNLSRGSLGRAEEAGQLRWSPRESVGTREKAQSHPFSIAQSM